MLADNCHMAAQAIEIENRHKPANDIVDVLWLEANVDDGWRRRRTAKEDVLAEVAITGDQNPLFSHSWARTIKSSACGVT